MKIYRTFPNIRKDNNDLYIVEIEKNKKFSLGWKIGKEKV